MAVFVSFGCFLFLSPLAFGLCYCCLIKKRKKKTQETDIIRVDEHKHVAEAIVPGPLGEQVVVLSVEDDVQRDKEMIKNEGFCHGLHAKPSTNEGTSINLDVETTTSDHDHHHDHHQQLENKP